MKFRAFIAVLALVSARPAAASIYPMMGGSPMRQSRGLQPSSVQGPLQMKWTSRAGGGGWPISHPTILEDRIVFANEGGYTCMDRQTGKVLWVDSLNAVAQPSYDPTRDLLYSVDAFGTFHATSPATGSDAWSVQLSGHSQLTLHHSVLLQGNKAYFANGNTSFICLDLDSRQETWRYTFPQAQPINTAALNQGKIFVTGYYGHVACLDAASGAVQWTQDSGFPYASATLASDSNIYMMLFSGAVECRSQADGHALWRYQTLSYSDANLAWCNGMLVVATDDRIVRALDAQTGQTMWEHGVSGNFASGGPMIVCGNVFISGCTNSFYGFDSSTGNLNWSFPQFAANSFGEFAEADGQVFSSDASGLVYCFVAKTPQNPALCTCNAGTGLSPTPTPQPPAGPCGMSPDSSLILWLKADQGVTQDSQGKVSHWADLSGHGRDASASGIFMPSYLASGLDGKPALLFDGVSNAMPISKSASMIDLKNDFTVVIKSWTDTSDPKNYYQEILSNSQYAYTDFEIGYRKPGQFALSSCQSVALTLAATANQMSLIAYRSSFSGIQVFKNAVLTANLPALPCAMNTELPYAVGAEGNLANFVFKGQISEILVYSKALSQSELEAMESCDVSVMPSHTVTPTVSRTFTVTQTPTPWPTWNLTAMLSRTATFSLTPTYSPTATAIATATPTASPAISMTASPTPSTTQSLVSSPTASQTATPSATRTMTLTPSPTAFSPTISASATRTPTFVPLATQTPQPTKGLLCEAPLIGQALAYPNPSCTGSDLKIGVKLGCGADKVCTGFYSLSGEKICEWTEAPQQAGCGDWIHTQCPQGVHFCNGTYFARVSVTYQGRTENSIAKFVVLR